MLKENHILHGNEEVMGIWGQKFKNIQEYYLTTVLGDIFISVLSSSNSPQPQCSKPLSENSVIDQMLYQLLAYYALQISSANIIWLQISDKFTKYWKRDFKLMKM